MFINQVRMKIGIVFGNPETTTGGQALKFYSTIRMEVRRAAAIKNGNDTIGTRTRVKVVKNKIAAPFKEAEFDVMFGAGISREGDVLDLAAEAEIIQRSGTWFTYGNDRLGQGRENAKEYLRERPELLRKIENEVRRKFNIKTMAEAPVSKKEAPAALAAGTQKGAAAATPAAASKPGASAVATPAKTPAAAASPATAGKKGANA